MHQRAVPETGRVFEGSFSLVVKEVRESGGDFGGVVGVVNLSAAPQSMQEYRELTRDGHPRPGTIVLAPSSSDAHPVALQVAGRWYSTLIMAKAFCGRNYAKNTHAE